MSGAEIVQVLRGRSFRDTLFGKVRYGQAVMRSADGVQCEVPVVIKEYDRELVERRMTKNGEHVGEDAKEELRIHSLLSQASPTTAPSTTSSSSSSSPAPSSGHPHVVHLYDVRKDERYYYAILQFCARGEFFPLVQHADFSPLYARHYFRQLMLGLQFMHRQHIAHRDLSLENILLDDKGDLKICDFGVAVQCADVNALMVDSGVPVGKVKFYMPPEVFARQPYSPAKVDVWTAGIILFVMLTKVHPFKYASAADARFMMVYSGKMNELLRRWGKEPLHPHAEDLLRRMLCPPEARISVDDILAHPYVREEVQPLQAERTLSSVAEEGKWDEPQQRPQLQHAASSYSANPSPPSSARQHLSPTSPSFHHPILPGYPTLPLSASSSIASRPSYPPEPSLSSATSPPASMPSAYSAQPPFPSSSSPHQPQQQPRAPLQPTYHHPLGQPPPSHAHPSNTPQYTTSSAAPPQPGQSHLVHLLQHHRPPPLAPSSQPSPQPLPQHYSRPVAPPGHYSAAPDMMQ